MSPWLGYVSQNSLLSVLLARSGHKRHSAWELESRSEEAEYSFYTWKTGARTPGAAAVHACCHLFAGSPLWCGAADRPAVRPAAAPPFLGSSISLSNPGPDALILWGREPVSSAGYPYHRSGRRRETDMGSRPFSLVLALARGLQCVLGLPNFTSIFPFRLPPCRLQAPALDADNSLTETV